MTKKDVTKKEWFIETSVLIKFFFGHSLQKNMIREHLKGAQKWSSFFVYMEYKRRLIKTLIDLYFVTKEEDTPSDALKYFAESFKQREKAIILSAIAELIKDPDISSNKNKFLVKLETFIRASVIHFESLIDNYVDNKTQCPLAKATFNNAYSNFIKEIDCITQCKIEKFWKANKNHMTKLVSGGEQEPHSKNKGFSNLLPLMRDAIKDPAALKTKQKCMKAGDVLIGLEMPKNLKMLTFDNSFTSICGILGKEILVLPSLAALRKDQ